MTRQDEPVTALRIELRQLPCPTCGCHELVPVLQCEAMPLAQVNGVSGFLSLEQKRELIRKITDVIVSVEGEGVRR